MTTRSTNAASIGVSNTNTANSNDIETNGFKVYGSLFKVDARYQFLNPLGKGSYGIVCAAKDRETGQSIAIKKVSPMAKRTVDAKHTLREILLLQFLGKHPNIISLHNLSANVRDDELYLIMDLMDTDMHRVIQSSQALSESHVKFFLHQLLRGVKYLHDNGVLHRDLKPGNLLLTKTCQLKIADFGLARKLPASHHHHNLSSSSDRPRSAPAMSSSSSSRSFERAPMTEHVVTRWYRAPELMLQPDGYYDQSVDMWSVGCIFAEILGRKALFPGKNFMHQLSLIFDVIGTPSSEATTRIKSTQAQRFLKSLGKKPKVPWRSLFPTASDDALDLLDKLLEFDPTKRLTAQEALAHSYMQTTDKKYKGIDPPPKPSLRVDFSFDNKKLAKTDLRALIVKEVDAFRRAVAIGENVNRDADKELSEEEIRERSTASSISKQQESGMKNGRFGGRVMCGSAGMSMIHSTLRQNQPPQDPQQQQMLTAKSTAGNGISSTHSTNIATIGSNRPRIRMSSKPPVPRQNVGASTLISNQIDHVVRVALHASELTTLVATDPIVQSHEQAAVSKPTCIEKMTATSVSSNTTASVSTKMMATNPERVNEEAEADDVVDAPRNKPDPAKAIETAIALGERAKALISTLAKAPSTGKTTEFKPLCSNPHTVTTTTKRRSSANPGVSSSSSSSPSSPSYSSSSSSDSDSDSRRLRATLVLNRSSTQHRDNTDMHNKPTTRRISSAGPTRSRTNQLHSTNNTMTTTTFNENAAHLPTARASSTIALIRAQRSNNHSHTLTESANLTMAIIKQEGTVAKEYANDRRIEETAPEADEEDAIPLQQPTMTATTTVSTLRPQRSTSQLPVHDPTIKKQQMASKRLTVPKSPKFSVMSWQKKRVSTVTGAMRK